MPIIVDNLTVSYQKRPAIHHVNCDFQQGESCAIFGPNGAGKSTLLKSCMQLTKTDTGSVKWENISRKNVAYLPQQCELDRSQPLLVYELVAMGLWYEIGLFGGLKKAHHQRIENALNEVNMLGVAQNTIDQLSNGQLQRILFARMLVQEADFLLLDEPFNAIDMKTTSALLAVLDNCQKQGKTIIAVLHDIAQIKAHFKRTILLNKNVIADGETNDVLSKQNLIQANAIMHTSAEADIWCEVA